MFPLPAVVLVDVFASGIPTYVKSPQELPFAPRYVPDKEPSMGN